MKRNSIIFLFLSLLVFVLFVLDLLSGDSALSVGQVWNVFTGNETDMTTRNIVLSIRLVRVIVAVLIGVALSISGLQMQTASASRWQKLSCVSVPGKDKWYIVYHRINKNHLNDGPGWHREVCIDRMEFNPDGTIKQVIPTP